MNVKNKQAFLVDMFFWIAVAFVIIGGVILKTVLAGKPFALHFLIWGILAVIVCLLISRTNQGRAACHFLSEAKVELKKVVWPSHQQTTQITLIVVAMVVLAAIFLWGLDALLLWAIGWITGQRG